MVSCGTVFMSVLQCRCCHRRTIYQFWFCKNKQIIYLAIQIITGLFNNCEYYILLLIETVYFFLLVFALNENISIRWIFLYHLLKYIKNNINNYLYKCTKIVILLFNYKRHATFKNPINTELNWFQHWQY